MVVAAEKANAYISALIVFIYTYFLGALFLGGDQEHYRAVYDVSSDSSLVDAYLYYRARIQSDEIGHFIISWLASQVFEKDLFNAFANAVLAYFSVRLFSRWGAHPFLALLISIFGYYHLAMYVSAERLKYASLFFVIGAFYLSRSRVSYWMFVASIVTHLQCFILLAVGFSNRLADAFLYTLKSFSVRVRDISLLLIAVLLTFFVFLVFYDHIFYKISAYHQSFHVSEYLRIFLFFLGSAFYSRDKVSVFSCFLVLFLMVGLVGGDRINLFGYFLFLFFAFRVRRGFNFGVISTFLYFAFGWAQYVFWVIDCGINRPC